MDYLRPSMVFVTGGTGMVGARIIYDLLKLGLQVKALYRKESGLSGFESIMRFYAQEGEVPLDKLTWFEGDILDVNNLKEGLAGCRYCVHAAALVSFHSKDHETMRKVNIEGTANVVNTCLAQEDIRLLYISSVAALGRESANAEIDEMAVWKDSPYNTGYAISKYHAELEVWRGIEEGLSAVMVNPSIILGAGDPKRSSGTIFGTVRSGLRFYTEGGASVVDVRDVSRLGLKLMQSPEVSGRFVLNSASLAYRELFDAVADAMGCSRPSIPVGQSMLQLAWRLFWLKDVIFGGRSPVTKETVMSSTSAYRYSSEKIKSILSEELIPWTESIEYFAPNY